MIELNGNDLNTALKLLDEMGVDAHVLLRLNNKVHYAGVRDDSRLLYWYIATAYDRSLAKVTGRQPYPSTAEIHISADHVDEFKKRMTLEKLKARTE